MANTSLPFALEPERVLTQSSLLIDGTPLTSSPSEIVPCSLPATNTNTSVVSAASEPAPDYDKALEALDRELDSALFAKAERRINAQAGYFERTVSVEDRDSSHKRQFVTLAGIRFIKLIQNGRPTLACRTGDLGTALKKQGAVECAGNVQTAAADFLSPIRAYVEFDSKWTQERLLGKWQADYTGDGRNWGFWDCNCVYAVPCEAEYYITIEGAMRLIRQYGCDALWVKLNEAYLNYYYPPKQWEYEAKAADDAAAAFLQKSDAPATPVTTQAAPLPSEAYNPIKDMTPEELERFTEESIGLFCLEDGTAYFVYDESEWAALTEAADELGYEPYYSEDDAARDYFTVDSEARIPTYGPKRSKPADAPVKEAV